MDPESINFTPPMISHDDVHLRVFRNHGDFGNASMSEEGDENIVADELMPEEVMPNVPRESI
jgi:hypothetical protein